MFKVFWTSGKVHMHMHMLVAWAKIILLVAWAHIFNNEFPALVVVNSNGLARSDPIDRSSCQTRQGCERGMRSGAGGDSENNAAIEHVLTGLEIRTCSKTQSQSRLPKTGPCKPLTHMWGECWKMLMCHCCLFLGGPKTLTNTPCRDQAAARKSITQRSKRP
jgi:hypothetical protein